MISASDCKLKLVHQVYVSLRIDELKVWVGGRDLYYFNELVSANISDNQKPTLWIKYFHVIVHYYMHDIIISYSAPIDDILFYTHWMTISSILKQFNFKQIFVV